MKDAVAYEEAPLADINFDEVQCEQTEIGTNTPMTEDKSADADADLDSVQKNKWTDEEH